MACQNGKTFSGLAGANPRPNGAIRKRDHPAKFRKEIAENLLLHYQGALLLDSYEPYQKFMELWEEIIQDDCWHISQNGWKPEISVLYSVVKKGKNKGQKKKRLALRPYAQKSGCRPFFAEDQQMLDKMHADLDAMKIELDGMEEEELLGDDPLLPLQTGKKGMRMTTRRPTS